MCSRGSLVQKSLITVKHCVALLSKNLFNIIISWEGDASHVDLVEEGADAREWKLYDNTTKLSVSS